MSYGGIAPPYKDGKKKLTLMADSKILQIGSSAGNPGQTPSLEAMLRSGRLMLLDGAMGTMIQSYSLSEEDFRGERFRDVGWQMSGNNDILCLTRPDVILDIHRRYLQAGADIITANTFNSQRISLSDYHCEELVSEVNTQAVGLARQAAREFSTPHHPRYVVATVGPTNKTLSISPDVSNPAMRALTYDEMMEAYLEQIRVLMDCGVDAVMLETVFDTLNCKAALHAYQVASEGRVSPIPLMLSITVSDKAGRLLCGQTIEAFIASVSHAPILSIGLNCSFGAHDMLPSLRVLAENAPYYISAHPNAGLPNAFGQYDQTPDIMYHEMEQFVRERLVNIIGGCCGTTPDHISRLSSLRELCQRGGLIHVPVPRSSCLSLSGLEVMKVPSASDGTGLFVNVGERCNVAGSRKFLRLIREKSYSEAISIARHQVEDGAMVIDINMDDGLLDAKKEMTHFLLLLGGEPDICRVPFMVDSSNWQVISSALKCIQGKCIVNSISLKEGEEVFLAHAREVRLMGAAVVVMAFDEQGQADTYERKIEICQRAYHLLTAVVGMPPQDIIFDPNILSVATGIPEHNHYALHFLRATSWIRQNLPGAHVSGGVSNLSFSFRGNNWLREAMHAVFLYHARTEGMDFGIVNPASRVMYGDIPAPRLQAIEDALLRPSQEHADSLIALAETVAAEQTTDTCGAGQGEESTPEVMDVGQRLSDLLVRGVTDRLEDTLAEALSRYPRAVDIIEGPLMAGMNRVGRLFGEGKMFLPQVVKTARCMKQAVAFLRPYISSQRSGGDSQSSGRVLLATVKGDVHDIGKNIVSVVMACNGYDISDLGVMVPAEEIVAKALQTKPDVIGLSGLITPSLEEMVRVVRLLKQAGLSVPVMIGGATTSEKHTALKIAPEYDGPVIWVKDASQNVPVAVEYTSADTKSEAAARLRDRQAAMRAEAEAPVSIPFQEARRNKPSVFFD